VDVRVRLDRAHPGEQPEGAAHLQVRRDLGAVRIAHVGQAHGPEQDRIRGLGLPQIILGQRRAGVAIERGAARQGLGDEAKSAGLALERFEHREAGLHHLEPDAIAGKHRDLELCGHIELLRCRPCRAAGHPPP
jgi:hypothetical protein